MKKLAVALSLLLACAPVIGTRAEAPAAWQGAVAKLIASRQSYPRSAQIRGEQGVTRLRIALSPDGKIGQVDLAQSSGSAILDREAQSVVSGLGKLPTPPAGITTLLVPIVWRLN